MEESTERNEDKQILIQDEQNTEEQTEEEQTNQETLHNINEEEIQIDSDHQEQAEAQNEEEREDIEVSPLDETMITSNISNHEEHIARSGYNLRPKRTPDYSYRFALLSVKAGIKKWGSRARDAVLDELRTFIKEKVFQQLKGPTIQQIAQALWIHAFIVEKRDGRIKARAVADGRTQKRYMEEETYSPTVKLESIMLSTLIDAHEQREVVTIDIKGAFLKAKVPEDMELIVKMGGELAQMMCELDPELQVDENGMLYLKCVKALYGYIEAARLFYNDLNHSLANVMGFKRNQYDPCVYNKDTNDGVVTVRVHVDNLKASARSAKILEEFIEDLRKIYGEITVHRGCEHDYLSMVMCHNKDNRSVTLDMKRYISGCIDEFMEAAPGSIVKTAKTPATENLFKVRDDNEAKLLDKQKAMTFHATVAKLLFMAKRGRPDILLAVSFLTTTRVKLPTEDDWKKLTRVLSYLKGTMDLCLTLSCSALDKLTWYIDGSYAVHSDMKGQSGATLMTGGCAVLCRSNKQKINTRSSTESELIAVDDALPTIQWTRSFLKEQGYDLETLIMEDNRSTMLLMKNGQLSSGKGTKHFDVRYFYVKDLLERGVINVEHCISDQMIADFFTKSRHEVPTSSRYYSEYSIIISCSTIQERVGKQEIEFAYYCYSR
jgi:hypothetical protein